MHYGALQHAIKMGFAALHHGRQAHNCKTKPNFPTKRQIIMVHSFDLLKHFFSPKQWATILLQLITHQARTTELLPLAKYLWKKDSHSFWLIPNWKNPTTPKTPCYRQFIPRPGLSSGWNVKKMQATRSKGHFKERWVPARAQVGCHHFSKK